MFCLIEVLVPGPWWNPLTYRAESPVSPGVRVRVPVGRGSRVGFVLGPASQEPENFALKPVTEVLDGGCILGQDLWNLALWMGKTFLCGPGLALQFLSPSELLKGEPASLPSISPSGGDVSEVGCFDPRDAERLERYRQMLMDGRRSLVLFSEERSARSFFKSLPPSLKDGALLWPSAGGKKLWSAWQAVRSGDISVVVAPPGGVSAPLTAERIVVEDEASAGYISKRPPRIPARSLAGHRALSLGAELVLGGRLPSSRTFLRSEPRCEVLPDRRSFVFADIRRSILGEERGVEGGVPLTLSLLNRTRKTLEGGRHALWILDRRGESAEVFCLECGHALRCPRCGGVMRSEERGQALRCVRCAQRESVPELCPDCRGALWQGRRPGLEALAGMAGRLVKGWPVFLFEGRPPGGKTPPTLFLGTRGALALCDSLDVGLAAWLDLDAELRKPEYGARFQAFSMVWESYWRSRPEEGRTVLIQGRCFGNAWRDSLTKGWERFWRGDLEARSALDLPPFGLLVQIDLPEGEDRVALKETLERAGFFVMDPGSPDQPLWVNARSSEPLFRALSPRFEIRNSQRGFPAVTVWSE